jgi:hypothetical protein
MCTGPEALALEASATRENIDEWESSYNQNNTIYIEWPPRSGLIVARIFHKRSEKNVVTRIRPRAESLLLNTLTY